LKKILVGIVVLFAVIALSPVTRVFSACNPEPEIINQLPRWGGGYAGSCAWYNGNIYQVTDSHTGALITDPATGATVGEITFTGLVVQRDTKGITYDRFRGTFWVKEGNFAHQVPVTGGHVISRIQVNFEPDHIAFGIWCDPDEENVMWVSDVVNPQIRKVNMLTNEIMEVINVSDPTRGVCRVGDKLWYSRAGAPGMYSALIQVDMQGNQLCKFTLPWVPGSSNNHSLGGLDVDPDGYLWAEGGNDTHVYAFDIGYVPTAPTPATSPTPVSPVIDSGDYNGDGFSDIAIFRESAGLWAIRGITRVYFGMDGDVPVSGDYDGDGTTDTSIFRGSAGLWAARGITRAYFGASSDTAIPGDFNGDGACDLAIFRPASGLWAVKGITRVYFGGSSDQPVASYLFGRAAGKSIAIFRPSSGLWAVRGLSRMYFGTSGDIPIFTNENSTEESPGIFRPASGLWAMIDGTRTYFGATGDKPVPGNYSVLPGNIGIFRGSSGLWAIRGVSRAYFGTTGDIPVSGLAINPSSAALL